MIGILKEARMDPTLLGSVIAIAVFGAIMVPSAAVSLGEMLWLRHWVYLLLAIAVFSGMLLVPSGLWQRCHVPAMALALLLCVAVLIPGVGTVAKGASRWIDLGFFTLQSSELAKVLSVIFLAGSLANSMARGRSDGAAGATIDGRRLLLPLLASLVLWVLLLAEPDFGSFALLCVMTGSLMFLAGVRLRFLLLGLLFGALVVAVLIHLRPYRIARMTAFTDPWASPFTDGYQLVQSLIAFGRGGFFGLGLGEGVQKLDYLPEAHNDFIFAVIVEELGLLGGIGLMLVFAFMIWRLLLIGRRAARQSRWHGSLLAYGAALLIGGQLLINLGVATGMFPTKGLTLPLVSYGGNSLIVCAMLLGLAFRVQLECDLPQPAPGTRRRSGRRATGNSGARRRG